MVLRPRRRDKLPQDCGVLGFNEEIIVKRVVAADIVKIVVDIVLAGLDYESRAPDPPKAELAMRVFAHSPVVGECELSAVVKPDPFCFAHWPKLLASVWAALHAVRREQC